MRPLSTRELLDLWEHGIARDREAQRRAIVAAACPDTPKGELGALRVGVRDARVLALREATFGPTLEAYAECPRCAARLQFALRTADLRAGAQADPPRELTVTENAVTVRFRLPTGEDLTDASRCANADEARRRIIERCVTTVTGDGVSGGADALSADVVARVAARMADADPQADIVVDLACAACDHRWPLVFDVTSYFWSEVAAHARRLLGEVHALARAYGWCEADILAMSAFRRRRYLELVES